MTDASKIPLVARWEWRTFARTLEALATRLGPMPLAEPRSSDEIYLLHLAGEHNAKIRGGVLDIKRIDRVSSEGLEQWRPVYKGRFPLARADLAAAFEAWEVRPSVLCRDTYTAQQFEEEIVGPHRDLRIARVSKTRRGFEFAGCMAELATVRVELDTLQSFSLEHEDPQRVLAALRALALDPRANTSYPRALKQALGLAPASAARES